MSTHHTDIATLRRDMVETCRRMNSSGINQGNGGKPVRAHAKRFPRYAVVARL